MIINEKEAVARLNSPINLINQLRRSADNSDPKRNNAMSLFGIGKKPQPTTEPEKFNPFNKIVIEPEPVITTTTEPDMDTILKNSESEIKLSLAHDKALDLLHRSVEMLSSKLDDVKAEKLPAVIGAASKTVESIRKERAERSKNNKDREVHFHFYTPEQKKLTDYEVIDVTASQ